MTPPTGRQLVTQLWGADDVSDDLEAHGFAQHALVSRGDSVMMVPMRPWRARGATPLRWTDASSVLDLVSRLGFGATLATGLANPLLRDRVAIRTVTAEGDRPTLHELLAEAFAVPEVAIAGTWGPPRPNQKPVLRVFDAKAGNTLGFAKIGWNNLTREIVEHESQFLASAPPLRTMRLPRVVSDGMWRGNRISVMTAELGSIPWRPTSRPNTGVMKELAAISLRDRRLLSDSPYRKNLADRVRGQRELEAALHIVDERWGTHELEFGHWHGDWSPWNMNSGGDLCVVWDWERTASGVPVGFDSLHYSLHSGELKGLPPVAALQKAVGASSNELASLGVAQADIPAVAVLYVIEMGYRFRGQSVAWLDGLLPAALGLFVG